MPAPAAAAGLVPLATLIDRSASRANSEVPSTTGTTGSGSAFGNIVDPLPDWSRPIIAILLALVIVLLVRSVIANRRARRLARQHRRLIDDLGVMQAALVPGVPERFGSMVASVAYRPADGPATGGDFYDAFELPEERVALLVGDASGHGREAIARATAVRYRLRAYIELGLAPRESLRAAGRALALVSSDTAFATALLAIHDRRTGTLTYACAGHPPPILVGPGHHEPVVACSSPPIGWGFPTGMRQTTVTLGPGSTACFFTDGLVEARNEGAMLGRDELERLVTTLPPDAPASKLLARVRDSVDQAPDDMAALLLRMSGEGPAAAQRVEELEVEASDLKRGTVETFLDACGLMPDEVLQAMRVVTVAARGGRAVLVRVELRQDGKAVEALERVGEDVTGPPFIQAAPDSRVEFPAQATEPVRRFERSRAREVAREP